MLIWYPVANSLAIMGFQIDEFLQDTRYQLKSYISIACSYQTFDVDKMRKDIDRLTKDITSILNNNGFDPAILQMVGEIRELSSVLHTIIMIRFEMQKVSLKLYAEDTREPQYQNCTKSTRLDSCQLKILQSWYGKNIKHPYLTRESIESLMRETGLSELQVKNWYVFSSNCRNQFLTSRVSNKRRKEKSTFISKELEDLLSSEP